MDMDTSLHVSALLLERYNLGEVTPEERSFVETTLIKDSGLQKRLGAIRESDAVIRGQGFVFPSVKAAAKFRRPRLNLVWGLAAAAVFAAVPFFSIFVRSNFAAIPDVYGNRYKGKPEAELKAYLKTDGEQVVPADQAILREGNTIQLAYTVQGSDRYGVIFSIDGRSVLTLHYPYTVEASTRLTAGKQTFLEEAYTLDDAPDYELFFFVIADKPVDVKAVLNSARQLARNPQSALERGFSVFKEYELKILNLRKE
jgi:hypothetical protein